MARMIREDESYDSLVNSYMRITGMSRCDVIQNLEGFARKFAGMRMKCGSCRFSLAGQLSESFRKKNPHLVWAARQCQLPVEPYGQGENKDEWCRFYRPIVRELGKGKEFKSEENKRRNNSVQ